MKPVQTFIVQPTLPKPLAQLRELAMNYWWCWNTSAINVFQQINPLLWEDVSHNPVAMISQASQERLLELANDTLYVENVQAAHARFTAYMQGKRWYAENEHQPQTIAYFCAEFGIHESFSSYSGGLGVLAGDHLKSASDLGLPLVGVGLLYQEGYFHQYLTQNGWQNEQYQEVDFHALPVTQVRDANGNEVTISVELPLGTCYARIWRMDVGRVPLYLLDTNIDANENEELRAVTDRLYGGSTDKRIMQELILGVGGVRALTALGIEPSVCHINEGHAAFSMLERTRYYMQSLSMTFQEAWQLTSSGSVFTTHTPVPAGNEVFEHNVLAPYLQPFVQQLGISWNDFLTLGASEQSSSGRFSMTILGLNGSMYRNGVSELHGEVARDMWKDVWQDFGEHEVPITGLTNGIHTPTWVSEEMAELYDTFLGSNWRKEPHLEESWQAITTVPNHKLWNVRQQRRSLLVQGARVHKLVKEHTTLTEAQMHAVQDVLNPNILTIGFARRFATYKRADLLMADMDRLVSIVNNTDKPVQCILAGKAHPKDTQGKELIQRVLQRIEKYGLQHRIVFLEDYTMQTARLMVRGADVWLNTPRRPHEASGTSGMKVVLNGGLHFSILDGWWAEASTGTNGFVIGCGNDEIDESEQDNSDAESLYKTLENTIVPMFYTRDEHGIPHEWLAMVKESIRTNAWRFSSLRMVNDYANRMYRGGILAFNAHRNDNGQLAREFVRFKEHIHSCWPSVVISEVTMHGAEKAVVGNTITIQASIELGELSPEQVLVQSVFGTVDGKGMLTQARMSTLEPVQRDGNRVIYEGSYTCTNSGLQGCTVRVIPTHKFYVHLADARLARYA